MQKASGLSACAGQTFSSLSPRKRVAGLRDEKGTGTQPFAIPVRRKRHIACDDFLCSASKVSSCSCCCSEPLPVICFVAFCSFWTQLRGRFRNPIAAYGSRRPAGQAGRPFLRREMQQICEENWGVILKNLPVIKRERVADSASEGGLF